MYIYDHYPWHFTQAPWNAVDYLNVHIMLINKVLKKKITLEANCKYLTNPSAKREHIQPICVHEHVHLVNIYVKQHQPCVFLNMLVRVPWKMELFCYRSLLIYDWNLNVPNSWRTLTILGWNLKSPLKRWRKPKICSYTGWKWTSQQKHYLATSP